MDKHILEYTRNTSYGLNFRDLCTHIYLLKIGR